MNTKMKTLFEHFLRVAASAKEFGYGAMRVAILVIFVWIGGLKIYQYEANGIVPFVANSPFMSFFYTHANDKVITEGGKEVKAYMLNKLPEGATDAKKTVWHEANGTYSFAIGLGLLIVTIGVLVFLGFFSTKLGMIGEVLCIIMTLGTLSFLVTTPEVWVPNLGSGEFGFPLLSGAGRLVIKDLAILSGAIILLSNSAAKLLEKK